ncbi:MAG TPA: hypothetical protein VF794_31325 [Archangium sp.]|jgi:hypothetical protein|uniref:hypothetical protein n=1 Tax=Archangium sp. TaxID=1872627 RepID=UPI002EDB4742
MKKERSIQGQAPRELDEHELSRVVGGLIGPDQDIGDYPPWVLPYIRLTDLKLNRAVLQKVAIR